jgi:hypothetical protein
MILIRQRVPADDRLIYSSWLHSWFTAFRIPETTNGRNAMIKTVGQRLANGKTLVVCPAGDESVILGWLCHEGMVLDYAYTREQSRREGICRRLCEQAFREQPFTCINPTPRFARIAHRLGCMIREQESTWPTPAAET